MEPARKRCAVYTRKSSEEGLDQDFNSLHAQREACEAFIKSQASEGWKLIPTAYNDGGISGGTMDRPALKELMADIADGKVDVVVVYKVDRMTRSLSDFAKMVDVFDSKNVSFVAVTQQFNTTTSMGRLTLNVLLSFAQFEREVTGERIRDKLAASKKKGMWMGGIVPYGFRVKDRKLMVDSGEAGVVRKIYTRYLELGNIMALRKELASEGIRRQSPKGGTHEFSKSGLYTLLKNPINAGQIPHGKNTYPGLHEPLVPLEQWETVQQKLVEQAARSKTYPGRKTEPSPLIGKVFDDRGVPLTPTHTTKRGVRLRYYCSRDVLDGRAKPGEGWRVPARELERAVSTATETVLLDRHALSNALGRNNGGAVLQRVIDASRLLVNDPKKKTGLLSDIVERVTLRRSELTVAVGLDVDGRILKLERKVPMALKRRGVELKIVVESEAHRSGQVDHALLKAVARGHQWFERIKRGDLVLEISRREDKTVAYIRRVLQLAFLAPSIIEDIVAGTSSPHLTTQDLILRTKLDANWENQLRRLGISSGGPTKIAKGTVP